MTGEYTTQSETEDGRTRGEAADLGDHANLPEPREEAAQHVRYLWPSLMSLWQAQAGGER